MAEDISAEQMEEIDAIVGELWPAVKAALAGRGPMIQGAVLADLVAIWLAGHTGSNKEAIALYREELIGLHVEFVRKLIPVEEALLMERVKPQGRA